MENLFRRKLANGKGWIYGSAITLDNDCVFICPRHEYASTLSCASLVAMSMERVDEISVGRYTGMTDYFNDPVFEHDIIEARGMYGIVRFGSHAPHTSHLEKTSVGFYIEWQGEKKDVLRSDPGYWFNYSDAVIRGNTFDNPELLEVKT